MIIYKLTNKINGKCYIGQTIGTLENRWSKHCYLKSGCFAISAAIQKHGKNSFSKEIIGTYNNQEDLDNAEIYFIEYHNSVSPDGYNLKLGGDGGACSDETKAKISVSTTGRVFTEENRKNMSEAHKGKKLSSETKEKMSKASKGKPKTKEHAKNIKLAKKGTNFTAEQREKARIATTGKKQSPETIAKRVAKIKGKKRTEEFKKAISEINSIPIVCLNTGVLYPSQTEAAKQLKLSQGNIGCVLRGKRPHTGGLRFEYVKKDKK